MKLKNWFDDDDDDNDNGSEQVEEIERKLHELNVMALLWHRRV